MESRAWSLSRDRLVPGDALWAAVGEGGGSFPRIGGHVIGQLFPEILPDSFFGLRLLLASLSGRPMMVRWCRNPSFGT